MFQLLKALIISEFDVKMKHKNSKGKIYVS